MGKINPLLQRAIEIHNFRYGRAMQRAIEIKDFHPENNSQLDWEQEEEAYLNNIIRHIQEAQREAVERTKDACWEFLKSEAAIEPNESKAIFKFDLEHALTPDKILEGE